MICGKNIDILGHHPIDVFNLVSPLSLDIQICHTRISAKMKISQQVLYRGHKKLDRLSLIRILSNVVNIL